MNIVAQAFAQGEARGLERAALWHEAQAERLRKRIEAARGLPIERVLCDWHNRHQAYAAHIRGLAQ